VDAGAVKLLFFVLCRGGIFPRPFSFGNGVGAGFIPALPFGGKAIPTIAVIASRAAAGVAKGTT
jgi:hypothetical protein